MNFEKELVTNIEPIRQYVLAIALYHLFSSGLYNQLEEQKQLIDELTKQNKYDKTKLLGFFWYLHNEGILHIENDFVQLTTKGRTLKSAEPWYIMLIGGYGLTFHEMLDNLSDSESSCSRRSDLVGIGSCGISEYDAIPLTKSLMQASKKEFSCLLDLGCGNAAYLINFCRQFPNLSAIGVEPSAEGFDAACSKVAFSELKDKISLFNTTAQDFMKQPIEKKPDLIVLGFVLHEILGQDGEQGVINFLKNILDRYPEIYLIVIEVDDKIQNSETMRHPLAKAYYNPYYLLHYFTKQKLISPQSWLRIFNSIGLECVAQQTTLPNIDSTGLEIGFLLRKAHDDAHNLST